MVLRKLLKTIIFLLLVRETGICQHALPLDSSAFVDTRNKPIVLQKQQSFIFENGIGFSNEFKGGRLNGITRNNDSTFTVLIRPENSPINHSPWYAFKIWANQKTNIRVHMKYEHGRHRYRPKLSDDLSNWEVIGDEAYFADSAAVYFNVGISQDTIWVAAQPLLTTDDVDSWSKSLYQTGLVKIDTVGFSVFNRPIYKLYSSKPGSKKKIIVISRQHPPEVTGYVAMKAFVETVWGKSKLASKFRKKYGMIVYPMLNPDGVDLGHWRHNGGGIDLNRDWHFYRQPEIKAVVADISKEINEAGTKVLVGADFHSTWSDLFYTNENDTLAHFPDFIPKILQGMSAEMPGFVPDLRPGGNLSPTSKSWFYNYLHASAVTYEVGDNTPMPVVKERGSAAAKVMMTLLLSSE